MPVTERHFGAIYSAYPQDTNYLSVLNEIGLSIGRWPGGTLAETRPDVYDIGSVDILDPTTLYAPNPDRSRLALEEAFELSHDGQSLNIIVPTFRYLGDLDQAASDLTFLLENISQNTTLTDGTIRLELGNEYYDSDELTSSAYGEMADHLLAAIETFKGTREDTAWLEVLVQLGRTEADNSEILASIDPSRLDQIDGLVAHTLPINLRNLYNDTQIDPSEDRFSGIASRLSDWNQAMDASGNESVGLHLTAWTVGASAGDPNDVDLNFQDYGARGGVTALATFGELIRLGVEEAMVWGVGVENLNSLGSIVDDTVTLSHSGTVLKELRDSVVGLELHEASVSFDWDTGSIEFGKHYYYGNGRMVVYAASGDDIVSGTTFLPSKALGFDAETAELVSAKRIESEYVDGYTQQGNEFDRLYEEPIVVDLTSDSNVGLNGSWLNIIHTAAHQVSEYTISWLHRGTQDADDITGYQTADRFDGMAGDDRLYGYQGDDELTGSSGNDSIWGGQDDDLVDGGGGNDELHGESGNDVIRAGSGQDTLIGGLGNDFLQGGDGDDLFIADDMDIANLQMIPEYFSFLAVDSWTAPVGEASMVPENVVDCCGVFDLAADKGKGTDVSVHQGLSATVPNMWHEAFDGNQDVDEFLFL